MFPLTEGRRGQRRGFGGRVLSRGPSGTVTQEVLRDGYALPFLGHSQERCGSLVWTTSRPDLLNSLLRTHMSHSEGLSGSPYVRSPSPLDRPPNWTLVSSKRTDPRTTGVP